MPNMPKDWRPYASAYLDDELESDERHAFEQELTRNPQLRREVEAMQDVKNVLSGMRLRDFPDKAWDNYRERTYNRLERGVGWILLSLGAVVLLGYGLYELVLFLASDAEVGWWVRAAIGLVCAGVALLLVSVIRERIFTWKRDPYREVKR